MPKDPSREAHFPAIEKRYGEKMSYWFKVMKEVKDEKYPQQVAYLRENYDRKIVNGEGGGEVSAAGPGPGGGGGGHGLIGSHYCCAVAVALCTVH